MNAPIIKLKKEAIPLLVVAVLFVLMVMLAYSVENIASNMSFNDLSVDSPFCYKDCAIIQPRGE